MVEGSVFFETSTYNSNITILSETAEIAKTCSSSKYTETKYRKDKEMVKSTKKIADLTISINRYNKKILFILIICLENC